MLFIREAQLQDLGFGPVTVPCMYIANHLKLTLVILQFNGPGALPEF